MVLKELIPGTRCQVSRIIGVVRVDPRGECDTTRFDRIWYSSWKVVTEHGEGKKEKQ